MHGVSNNQHNCCLLSRTKPVNALCGKMQILSATDGDTCIYQRALNL
jgi:hypothetical protein